MLYILHTIQTILKISLKTWSDSWTETVSSSQSTVVWKTLKISAVCFCFCYELLGQLPSPFLPQFQRSNSTPTLPFYAHLSHCSSPFLLLFPTGALFIYNFHFTSTSATSATPPWTSSSWLFRVGLFVTERIATTIKVTTPHRSHRRTSLPLVNLLVLEDHRVSPNIF